MEWVKLEDCFEFIRNGANIKQFGNDGLPITRIETISDRTVNKEKVGYANIKYPEYSDYYLKYNDILMSHINSETHLGKVAIYKDKTGEVIIHGMNLLCLRSNEKFLADYLYYFFNSIIFKNQLNKIMKKSVNQASFNITNLKNLKVPNKSLSKQKNIVSILSKIETLIQTRQDQVQALDDLVESVFDELLNKNDVNFTTLDNLITKKPDRLSNKNTEPISYFDISSIDNISHKIIEEKNILNSEDRPSRAKQLIMEDDVIVSTVRPNLKNIAYFDYKNTYTPIASTGFAVLRANKSILNPKYLFHIVLTDYFTNILISVATGANYPAVKESDVRNIKVPIIDIEKQNLFAAFVEKIEKQKQILNDSLGQLTMLFDSLMQDAFDGSMSK